MGLRCSLLLVLYLVHLALLQPVVRGGRGGSLLARGVAEVEVGVTKAAVPIHAVQALPHHPLLVQEALVRHQQVKVALGRRDRGQSALAGVRGCPAGSGAAPCA